MLSRKGSGIQAAAMAPSTLNDTGTPRLCRVGCTANGRLAAKNDIIQETLKGFLLPTSFAIPIHASSSSDLAKRSVPFSPHMLPLVDPDKVISSCEVQLEGIVSELDIATQGVKW